MKEPKKRKRGIRANGEKIKELREAKGLSQIELIQPTTVQIRTYQRAEAGENVSVSVLGQIADALGVNLNEIRSDISDDDGGITYLLQRYPSSSPGLPLSILVNQNFTPEFQFEISFDGDSTKLVSDLVHEIDRIPVLSKQPVSLVDSLGKISTYLKDLEDIDVHLFFGRFQFNSYLRDETVRYSTMQTMDGGQTIGTHTSYWVPMLAGKIVFLFSNSVEDTLLRTAETGDFKSKEDAYRFCIKNNISERIEPSTIRGSDCEPGFQTLYEDVHPGNRVPDWDRISFQIDEHFHVTPSEQNSVIESDEDSAPF